MPKPTSREGHAWAQGYERGSVLASMTPKQRQAYRRWLADKAADSRVFERGLKGSSKAGKSARSKFAEV